MNNKYSTNLNETSLPVSNDKISIGSNRKLSYDSVKNDIDIKVYKKRFFILLIFSLYSMSNSFQWIEYSIVTTIIAPYYNVSNLSINYTSMIFMILYIPGIIPATWILSKKGLRFCVCLGAFGTCLGSFIKCFSTNPDQFWILMIGQCIVAIAQLFIINIPPELAAKWFPSNEVSSATAFGVFGNQIGIALGFVLPPYIITLKDTGYGLMKISWLLFTFTLAIFVLILIFFNEKPKKPPSLAQSESQTYHNESNYTDELKIFFKDYNFILMFITYGINVGVFYAISTLLEQMISSHFKNSSQEAGGIGLLITVAGTVGSVICGYILDKTQAYKATTLILYALSFIGMILFTFILYIPYFWPIYLVSIFLGFFMTGYLPIGFEYAAEITYPQSEGTSAGLLNMSAQIFGILFTFLSAYVLNEYGDFESNILLSAFLLIGLILTSRITSSLKRPRSLGKSSIITP